MVRNKIKIASPEFLVEKTSIHYRSINIRKYLEKSLHEQLFPGRPRHFLLEMFLSGLGCVTIRKGLPSVTLPLSVRPRGPPAQASRLQVCSCTTSRDALSPYLPTRSEAQRSVPKETTACAAQSDEHLFFTSSMWCLHFFPTLTAFSCITVSYLLQWLLNLLLVCVVWEALNELVGI